ncbi:Glycosyltransferase involved in cell wall bisynthesis [Flaviramulus basaltis]|uniref:Glycosyltransferase involved in cell wall bisynthesis n=1 Tax=Flaviramulus basaltis TaxID=369401 RepID=A0A1K2IP53_9FLAO|nr:glycosyltransferase [Flaviramulus basaltis]SFZ94034.1 Glycosyltransferase involved in cell wall bisynthesis [Flaviramulus basaltis]
MKESKKILRVISSMNPKGGGPCQGIRNSIPELQKLGIQNDVVCLDASDSDYLEKDDFNIYAIGTSKGPWAYNENLIPWLVENALNYKAIIIHGLWQFNSYAVYKAVKTLKSKKNKAIPYYVMPHGMLDPYFQKAPERRIKAIRNWLFWKFIEGKVVNNANGILFTCEEELLLARETFIPYKPNKELNVGYGILEPPKVTIQIQKAFENTCPEVYGKPFLLFLSRIHHKKGVDILLKAYYQWVSTSNIKDPIKLVIAGPGLESNYGKELLEFINSKPILKDHIFFTGMLSGDSKWGAFYASEAFILNSHQENFGISIVESLACGKPVLISNKVNIWREIKEGHAGFVEDDTLSGTLNLFKNWEELNSLNKVKMRENAKKIFKKFYAINPAANRLKEAVIDEID